MIPKQEAPKTNNSLRTELDFISFKSLSLNLSLFGELGGGK